MDTCIIIKRRPYRLKGIYITNLSLREKIKECKRKGEKFFVRETRTGDEMEDRSFLLYTCKKMGFEKNEELSKQYNIDIFKMETKA